MTQEVRSKDMTRVADFALYDSKAAGRGCHILYDANLEAQFNARRDLVQAIPHAVPSREIEVFLQPKVDLVTSEPVSFEALARWRGGDNVLPPRDSITIAEETGMIVEIDRFVVVKAVEIFASWNSDHRKANSVTVNLSALHFKGEGGLDFVSEALRRRSLPPELPTQEITETEQLDNWTHVGRAVADLRATVCRISIDDFGAAFSSLAYPRMINADELKIDRALICEIKSSNEGQSILDTVLELAEHLGLAVIVEGIEEHSQLFRLTEMGCRVGQGF